MTPDRSSPYGGGARMAAGWTGEAVEDLADAARLVRPSGQRGYAGRMDPDAPTREQLETLRRLTPEERYRASRHLYWTLRRHKAAFLQSLHPDWDDQRIGAEVARIFLRART